MFRTAPFLTALLLVASACGDEVSTFAGPLEVNLQVTGAQDADPMLDEIEARGWVATLWQDSEEIDAGCSAAEARVEYGHELAGIFPGQIVEETTADEQRTAIEALQEVIPRCTGQNMAGFRASRFSFNDDTPAVLDETGVKYFERSARAEFTSVYTFKPYAAPGHDYAILPMPIRVHYGEVGSLCDTSSCGDMTAEEFERYVQTAIDFHLRHREPLIIEWHPDLTNPDDPDGWWDAFLGVADRLEAEGEEVEFVTALELVERYVDAD